MQPITAAAAAAAAKTIIISGNLATTEEAVRITKPRLALYIIKNRKKKAKKEVSFSARINYTNSIPTSASDPTSTLTISNVPDSVTV